MTIDHALVYPRIYPVIGLIARKRLGHLFIFTQYGQQRRVKRYYYPENPRTATQQSNRVIMHDAVNNWLEFDEDTKNFYNQLTKPKAYDGYRRYISLYLQANKDMIIYWDTLEQNAQSAQTIPEYVRSYLAVPAGNNEIYMGVNNEKFATPQGLKEAVIMARAFLSSAQDDVADASYIKVLLDGETFDIGENYDTANKRFVAPITGYYRVMASVGWKTVGITADKRYISAIYVNGSAVTVSAYQTAYAGSIICPVSGIVHATAGQFIELYCRKDTGATTEDLDNSTLYTFMNVEFIKAS